MTIDDHDDQIKDEKMQYDSDRAAVKISSGKIDKQEYFAGKEIFLSNQKQLIKQDKFTYYYLN